ncbi:MAG: NAD-dependent epimerase/dehydratase family protein [Candidatus Diapherotrites archaeon]
MKILLTGSTGMIGNAVRVRLEKKYTLVEASKSKGIDITQKEDAERVMKGVDVVVHAAATIDERTPKEEMYRINVEGTRNLLNAAEKENVSKFIFISSVGIFGKAKEKLDEQSIQMPETNYEKSKAEAEKLVWNMQEVFPIVIIRPALVVGPNDYWKRIFSTIKKGFPLIGKGKNKWQMVDVDDLADFIALCVKDKEIENEAFIVAEEEMHTLREVVDMIADIQGVKRPKSIPQLLGVAGSYVFLLMSKITGKPALLIPAHVRRMGKHREYDTTKARAIGWKPKYSTKESLQKTYDILAHQNIKN